METRFTSLRDRLDPDGHPSGFDYLRIILSLLILADHSVFTCLGEDAQRELFGGFGRPIAAGLVPMFFALSGFLVAGSLVRSRSLVTFAGLRIFRIFPALAVDTLFCALILGVIFTDLPIHKYFEETEFRQYFLNIFGFIHYRLPGVFAANPSPLVNVQLWTIPFELQCYLVLAAMAAVGLHRRRALFLFASGLITLGTAAYAGSNALKVVDVWHLLMPSFLIGVAAYLYRDVIEWSYRLMAVALAAMVILLDQTGPIMIAAAIPLVYVTVWLGTLRPKRDRLIRSGDYSYPLYLYSFPIQQAIIVLLPAGKIWWINLLLALPTSFLFAAFSWHLIEKPLQRRRSFLYALENRRLSRQARS
jgi:peptidoglycan/LPS O-acetylase OafA/YrhL